MTIRQIRSANGANPKQRKTLTALGLGRIGKSVHVEGTPQILGMVEKVHHLVATKEA